MEEPKMASSIEVPIIDISPIIRESDSEGKAKVVTQIGQACSEFGFFQIVQHGLPLDQMRQALEFSRQFFDSPAEEKLKLAPKPGGSLPVGYFISPEKSPDKNEHFLTAQSPLGVNQYPDNPPQFREVLKQIFQFFTKLSLLVEGAIGDFLNLPPGFLKEYNNDRAWDFLLALHYFPRTGNENNGKSAHQDSSCITFVFQNDVGGLEILKDGQWIPIFPAEGALVVNVGEVMQVLSNDKLKSAIHRVVRHPGRDRYSFAYFYNFHGDKWIEPLPQCSKEIGKPPKYRGFPFKDYAKLRLRNRTHPPARPEDLIGISHYAI